MPVYEKKENTEGSVVTYRSWIFLIFAALTSLAIILWIFFGSLSITIQGRGIIISKNGLTQIEAKVAGTVAGLRIHPGEKVKKGDILLEIYDPQIELKLNSAKTRVQTVAKELSQLQKEIENERTAAQQALQAKIAATQFSISQLQDEIDFLNKKLVQHKGLLDQGLISGAQYHSEEHVLTQKKIDLEEKRSALNDLIAEAKKEYRPEELRNKEQQLLSEEEQRDVLEILFNEGVIVSPDDGTVLEVMVNTGDQVQAGKQLVWLEKHASQQEKNRSIIYAYFPVESGERIKPQTQVEMTIPEVNYNEFGAIIGKVVSVSQYAVSKENIYNNIQNKSLVANLIGTNEAVVEVIINPMTDPVHPGHFLWTSHKIPPFPVATGTVGVVDAPVEKVRPLYYIIPLPIFKYPLNNR